MGCVSSKLARGDFQQESSVINGNTPNHVVSLTSTTYGVLQLDQEQPFKELKRSPPPPSPRLFNYPKLHKRALEEPEIINAWELMQDLEDDIPMRSPPAKWTPKLRIEKKPFALFSISKTPKKQKFCGKENMHREGGGLESIGKPEFTSRKELRPLGSLENLPQGKPRFMFPTSSTAPVDRKLQCHRNNSGSFSASRRSLGPLFDPELIESLERDLSEEKEQIKMMVSPAPKSRRSPSSDSLLGLYEKKCPPGGESTVILYTTTLRGIRKTFEDCNKVRSVVESHGVQVFERDISMDSGFREELRKLMGPKNARVPMVFLKGRLIGGPEEVLKLDEEGTLGVLLEGMPQATGTCQGCGGVRFVMCMDCSGRCKVLDTEQKTMVKCGECNENGLIRCSLCC